MDCSSFWMDHDRHTLDYVLARRAGNSPAAQAAVSGLMTGVQAWGAVLGLPHASDLMGVHVKYVGAFVDDAFLGNKKDLDPAVSILLHNSQDQTDLYTLRIPGFDGAEWKRLFDLHISGTGAYALALSQGDMSGFHKNRSAVIGIRDQLKEFWKKYCRPPGLRMQTIRLGM